jgi:D-alanyl-D-alanine carboxypeptidase
VADFESQLTDLVKRASGIDGPGAIIGVSMPLHGIEWQGAAGTFARGSDTPLRASDGFRIASMSKTFTATLVMRYVEAGKLRLDATLDAYFPREFVQRVHPDGASITLTHLLNHTAGLWDFALSEAWSRELRKDFGRFRAPQEILEWAVAHGAPVGPVGGGHVYSDTGFVLLGRILEELTGTSYAQLCRQHIFDPLGMNSTWLEGHEAPRSTLSHAYVGTLDALVINGCVDWAAGGHVSTVADLATFLNALFRDGALVSRQSLDRMLLSVPTQLFRYGLGVSIRREAAPERPDTARTMWGHGGHWGSWMFYLPEWRGTLVGTVNRAGLDNRWIAAALIECVQAQYA